MAATLFFEVYGSKSQIKAALAGTKTSLDFDYSQKDRVVVYVDPDADQDVAEGRIVNALNQSNLPYNQWKMVSRKD